MTHKTNAVRILDQMDIHYELREYEVDPDDLTALSRLDVLYQTAGNWQELLSILQHEAELTADPTEAVSFQYRIAELYERHLGDIDRSVASRASFGGTGPARVHEAITAARRRYLG